MSKELIHLDEDELDRPLWGQQSRAAQLLAAGNYVKGQPCYGLIKAVAEECNLTVRTINYWTHMPHFILAIEANKAKIDVFAMSMMKKHMEKNFVACLVWMKARQPRIWDEGIRRDLIAREVAEAQTATARELPTIVFSDTEMDDLEHEFAAQTGGGNPSPAIESAD